MPKVISLIIIAIISFTNTFSQDTLLTIITEELNREFEVLKNEEFPPYYMDYKVEDAEYLSMSSTFGSLIRSKKYRNRAFVPNIRIGSYKFDNSHLLEDDMYNEYSNDNSRAIHLPLDNKALAIKKELWKATDWAYVSTVNAYRMVLDQKNDSKVDTLIADFSKEKPNVYYEAITDIKIDDDEIKKWEKQLKELTAPFVNDSLIISADAYLSASIKRNYFVSTEGSSIVQNFANAQLYVVVLVKDNQGNITPYNKSYNAKSIDKLPSRNQLLSDLNNVLNTLELLKQAQNAKPFTGPAILSASAAGVFFHEIFGHRIEGHRLKSNSDGQTFKDKTNQEVLPKTFNVSFDPNLVNFDTINLNGHYKFDDEGISGKKVSVVNNGILTDFLMSRSPINSIPNSNGHGRAQIGKKAVSRQSNMVIETTKSFTDAELRKKLIKACKKQKKEYGYYFDEVIGGFTITNRYMPNVFNISPTKVYKIYVDGRPDELVKGVGLIGTPLAMFSMIDAAGDTKAVFNGYCGAESGSVPVSTIAPSIFVKQIETQLMPVEKIEIPLLPRPGISDKNKLEIIKANGL